MKYAIIDIKNLNQVCEMSTPEEAYDMLKKWKEYDPSKEFEMMEKVD